MIPFDFYKFSPGGNTTVFLRGPCPDKDKSYYCREAISESGLSAEQAAWVNLEKNFFEMAGGEFCVNACRAFGALLDIDSQNADMPRAYKAQIGKFGPIDLMVEGRIPAWRVKVVFKQNIERIENHSTSHAIVQFPGINHLLIKVSALPLREEIPIIANKLSQQYSINSAPAFGVTFWTQSPQDNVEILPYIQVPEINTAVVENSCGSASVALSLIRHIDGLQTIRQPSGEILEVLVNNSRSSTREICVSGSVELVAQGQIWLK